MNKHIILTFYVSYSLNKFHLQQKKDSDKEIYCKFKSYLNWEKYKKMLILNITVSK